MFPLAAQSRAKIARDWASVWLADVSVKGEMLESDNICYVTYRASAKLQKRHAANQSDHMHANQLANLPYGDEIATRCDIFPIRKNFVASS